jgi:tape measure domain-containing protein
MGESVDIIVSEAGTDQVSEGFAKLSEQADKSAQSVDNANSSLSFLKETANATTTPLQTISAASADAAGGTAQMAERVTVAESAMRAAQSTANRLGITLEEYNARTAAFVSGTDAMSQSLQENSNAVGKTEEAHKKNKEAMHQAKEESELFKEATKLLTEVLTFLGLALSVEKLIDFAETFEIMEIKVSSVSRSAHDLHDNMSNLFAISQRTGSSFQQNAAAFQKLAVETTGLGIDQKDLLHVIEGVDQAVRLSGGTTKDAGRAMDVFSRSLATGQVEGRIFRTVLRDFPELGQLVAKGLGVPISSLTGFGAASKTSSKDFVEGFNKAAKTAEEVGKTIPLTLGAAIQTLVNSAVNYVGHLNEASHATSAMAGVIVFLADHFSTIATIIRVAATAFASYYAIAVIIPGVINLIISSLRALTVAALANPFTFMIVAITTLIALVYQFGDAIKLNASGSISLLGAFIGTWNVLKTVLINIWSFVGGPLTIAFQSLFTFLTAPFRLLIMIIQGVMFGLEKIGAIAAGSGEAFNAMVAPITKFKEVMGTAMEEASKGLQETDDHSKTLAERLGGEDPNQNVSGAANKAAGSVGHLNDVLTQNGRVNAAAIPPFENLLNAHKRADAAIKGASENMKEYSREVDENSRKVEELALTTRDAMGNIVKYTSETAKQSGEFFNGMKKSIDSVTESLQEQQAATRTSGGGGSSGGGGGGGGGGGHTQDSIGLQSWDPGDDIYGPYGRWTGGPGSPYFGHTLTAEEQTKVANVPGHFWSPKTLHDALGFANGGSFQVGGTGGTDSQLVQFMASPDENVTIETPEQVRRRRNIEQGAGGNKSVIVNMDVRTPDVGGFRRSKNQMLLDLRGKLGSIA